MGARTCLLAAIAGLAGAVTIGSAGATAASVASGMLCTYVGSRQANTMSSGEVAVSADPQARSMPVAARARATGIAFEATVDARPSRPAIETIVDMRVSVANEGASTVGTIVQVNVYGAPGKKIDHKDIRRQPFASGETRVYDCQWRPSTSGKYIVKVGTFSPGWRRNYYWNDSAKVLRVQ